MNITLSSSFKKTIIRIIFLICLVHALCRQETFPVKLILDGLMSALRMVQVMISSG